jgi:hypothetical protein
VDFLACSVGALAGVGKRQAAAGGGIEGQTAAAAAAAAAGGGAGGGRSRGNVAGVLRVLAEPQDEFVTYPEVVYYVQVSASRSFVGGAHPSTQINLVRRQTDATVFELLPGDWQETKLAIPVGGGFYRE